MRTKLILPPKEVSLGTTKVLRAFPRMEKRNVGPFVFLDYIPPERIPVGKKISILRHPHIGLSTVTYLFDGALVHRDSLGVVQTIRPGEINWMTAGYGITHSERSDEELEKTGFTLHGLQFWVALPKDKEDNPPEFQHVKSSELPFIKQNNCTIQVLAGELLGEKAETRIASPLLLLDIRMKPNSKIQIPTNNMELGIFLVSGSLKLESGEIIKAPNFILPEESKILELESLDHSVLSVFGGENFPESRFIDWNFVSSSKEKIQSAKLAWQNQDLAQFGNIEGETDWIRLH